MMIIFVLFQLTALKRPRSLLVFINPFGGKRRAPRVFEETVSPLMELAKIRTHVISRCLLNQKYIVILKLSLYLTKSYVNPCYIYTFHMYWRLWYTLWHLSYWYPVDFWRSNNAAIFNSCFSHYTCRTCQGGDNQVRPAVSGRVSLTYNASSLSRLLSSSLFCDNYCKSGYLRRGLIRIFYGQTIRICFKYAEVRITSQKFQVFNTCTGLLYAF